MEDLVEDIIKLERKPSQCEESDHHHQHLDHLHDQKMIVKADLMVVGQGGLVGKGYTFFLLFIIWRSLSSWAAPGVLELHRATAILGMDPQ